MAGGILSLLDMLSDADYLYFVYDLRKKGAIFGIPPRAFAGPRDDTANVRKIRRIRSKST